VNSYNMCECNYVTHEINEILKKKKKLKLEWTNHTTLTEK
jgi:hypothetical protein